MPLGLLDLSIVTHRLIQQLKDFTASSHIWDGDPSAKFTVCYTGLAPDAARIADDQGDCHVSLYLFHVSADKFHRNTYPKGGSAQRVPEQPLALSLYYLLTAYSKTSFIKEQQAMSIALKCLHEHPVLSASVTVDREEEFTLTIEPQTVDEIGRLWQAISSPLRLSAVYRASVMFVPSPAPIAPKVVRVAPELGPAPFARAPEASEMTVTAGADGLATIVIAGAGFVEDGAEMRIRALSLDATADDPPGAGRFRVVNATTVQLRLPAKTPPGRYRLSVRPAVAKPTIELWLVVP